MHLLPVTESAGVAGKKYRMSRPPAAGAVSPVAAGSTTGASFSGLERGDTSTVDAVAGTFSSSSSMSSSNRDDLRESLTGLWPDTGELSRDRDRLTIAEMSGVTRPDTRLLHYRYVTLWKGLKC